MSKHIVQYEVVSLPSNRQKLAPQLQVLVETIEEQMDKTTRIVSRDDVYKSWIEKLKLESNDKVFASYIHQLVSFAFLDRLNVKAKKEPTVAELKEMIAKQMQLLKEAEKAEELARAINQEANDRVSFRLSVREAEAELA